MDMSAITQHQLRSGSIYRGTDSDEHSHSSAGVILMGGEGLADLDRQQQENLSGGGRVGCKSYARIVQGVLQRQ